MDTFAADQPRAQFRHSLFDDVQGLAFGVLMTAFSVVLLKSAGLVTGQIAGLAVLISYASGWGFAPVFFVLNIPFYALALKRRGARFTLYTLAVVAGLSAVTALLPMAISFNHLDPWLAALLAGCCAGVGLIALFRHGASAGGLGIVALIVQEKTGFRAGWFQQAFDAVLFAAAFFVLDPVAVFISLFGAFVLNAIIALNHRPERYPVSL
ncbi:MAG: YitT family protein [Hyphomicrobiales bacterium]|nr:MAG: YitT family protein [Hyphomicrobiales bacterium]